MFACPAVHAIGPRELPVRANWLRGPTSDDWRSAYGIIVTCGLVYLRGGQPLFGETKPGYGLPINNLKVWRPGAVAFLASGRQ